MELVITYTNGSRTIEDDERRGGNAMVRSEAPSSHAAWGGGDVRRGGVGPFRRLLHRGPGEVVALAHSSWRRRLKVHAVRSSGAPGFMRKY